MLRSFRVSPRTDVLLTANDFNRREATPDRPGVTNAVSPFPNLVIEQGFGRFCNRNAHASDMQVVSALQMTVERELEDPTFTKTWACDCVLFRCRWPETRNARVRRMS